MEVVRLKNGSEEPRVLVQATMVSLNELVKTKFIVAYDLVMKCRDNGYKPFGKNGDILKQLALLEASGGVHTSIRNIVLSAANGDGMDMTIGSPIA